MPAPPQITALFGLRNSRPNASLARGTGEIDALYHVALHELTAAVHACGTKPQIETLDELVHHDRLRDLSALPTVLRL